MKYFNKAAKTIYGDRKYCILLFILYLFYLDSTMSDKPSVIDLFFFFFFGLMFVYELNCLHYAAWFDNKIWLNKMQYTHPLLNEPVIYDIIRCNETMYRKAIDIDKQYIGVRQRGGIVTLLEKSHSVYFPKTFQALYPRTAYLFRFEYVFTDSRGNLVRTGKYVEV